MKSWWRKYDLNWWSITVVAAVIVGLVLRFHHLGSIPSILNRDEAALAYNALLLKESGGDEWGKSWPLVLESFGDFKLPGYPMILVGFFTVFGYSDLIVRLPSALAGLLLLITLGLLVKELFGNKEQAALAVVLAALCPVLIFYARIGFEANVGLLFFTVMWYCLLKHVNQNFYSHLYWDAAALCAALAAVFTYNTPWLLLPVAIVLIPWWRGIKNWRQWLLPVLGLSCIFVAMSLIFIPLTSQKSGITIFSDETVWHDSVEYREKLSGVSQKILGNKYVYFAQVAAKNTFNSFSPRFLVQSGGDHPWHQISGAAHLSWLMYISGLIGMGWGVGKVGWALWHRKVSKEDKTLILLGLLTISALLPAVITVDAPHATRSLFFFVMWLIWSSYALILLLNLKWLQQVAGTYGTYAFISLLLLFSILETSSYAYKYFVLFGNDQHMWLPGFQTALAEVEKDHPNQPVAVVDPAGFQYILTAWYLKMSPDEYFSTNIRQLPDRIGFKYGQQVGRYHFVARSDDRAAEEKVLILWDDNNWRVETF